MIRVLSDKITEFLFQQRKITAKVKELCRYGLMLVNGNGVAMHGFHAHLHTHPVNFDFVISNTGGHVALQEQEDNARSSII